MKFNSLLCLMLSGMLTACGGGSGDSGDGQEPSVGEGVFLDSAVAGLEYRSGELTGVTDQDGKFKYEKGGDITFFIGGIVLGTARASATMTPLDFSEVTARTVLDGEVKPSDYIINVLRFLQSLDNDGNPDNGIQILEGVANLADGKTVDFELSIDDFTTKMTNLVAELTATTEAGTRVLVDETSALNHFKKTLVNVEEGEEISPEEYRSRIGTGVSLYETFGKISLESSIPYFNSETYELIANYTLKTDTANRGFRAQIVKQNAYDACTVDGERPIEENKESPCGGIRIFDLGGDRFRLVLGCAGAENIVLQTKISNSQQFNFGSMSFSSDQYEDFSISSDVCGFLEEQVTQFEYVESDVPQELLEDFEPTSASVNVSIRAPYLNSYLLLNISFDDVEKLSEVSTGEYSLDEDEVDVYLRSFEFGVTDSGASTIGVNGGLVTISEVRDLGISGSYNLTTYSGDTLEGSFNLNLPK